MNSTLSSFSKAKGFPIPRKYFYLFSDSERFKRNKKLEIVFLTGHHKSRLEKRWIYDSLAFDAKVLLPKDFSFGNYSVYIHIDFLPALRLLKVRSTENSSLIYCVNIESSARFIESLNDCNSPKDLGERCTVDVGWTKTFSLSRSFSFSRLLLSFSFGAEFPVWWTIKS